MFETGAKQTGVKKPGVGEDTLLNLRTLRTFLKGGIMLGQLTTRVQVAIVVVFALCAAAAMQAQTYQQLAVFNGTNGSFPQAAVVEGLDGNLYGTTKTGGVGDCPGNCGTIFKMTPQGELSTVYEFCKKGGACIDGDYPVAALVLGKDGNFYGTTSSGGKIPKGDSGVPSGILFKITPEGKLHTFYSFCKTWPCPDGAVPQSSLIQGTDGDFYGTTYGGGVNGNFGTIFKVTAAGALTTLYSFCPDKTDCTDGELPTAGLVQATDGNFYGVAQRGGICLESPCDPFLNGGVVFRITPAGAYSVLYSFCSQANCADGSNPSAPLVQASDGNLYGTTIYGGGEIAGTTFKISTSGTFTQIDGSGFFYPNGIIQATDGNFYSTTGNGGAGNSGSVFQMTPTGAVTFEYSFCNCDSDGEGPAAGVFQATDGTFYGTTTGGFGTSSNGTVYSLSMGLTPFVQAIPNTGKVGNTIKIIGTELAGVSKVTFNGLMATYTQISDTEITAKVPKKATSGLIQVTVPSGTLSSNVPFQVIK
jgi:uncharacterized repeat protein (TIGR03803 family)